MNVLIYEQIWFNYKTILGSWGLGKTYFRNYLPLEKDIVLHMKNLISKPLRCGWNWLVVRGKNFLKFYSLVVTHIYFTEESKTP